MSLGNIEPQDIEKAVSQPDLDSAIGVIMNLLGVTTGDVAGLYCSDRCSEEDWVKGDYRFRFAIITGYYAFEKLYAECCNEE
jgi:hypothetical protein